MSAVSSTPYGAPLDIAIRPSRLIATLICGMHLLAVIVCVQIPLPLSYRAALLLAIVAAFFWNGYLYTRRVPRRLSWSVEQGWRLTDHMGVSHDLDLLPEAYIGPWLVTAHFRDERRRRRTMLLAQDSTSPDNLRRLKVLLRYGVPKQ